jgi:hypothetical protein
MDSYIHYNYVLYALSSPVPIGSVSQAFVWLKSNACSLAGDCLIRTEAVLYAPDFCNP